MPAGKVTIAGAGPGQLEHLTLAALRAIHQADVILYDALIDDSILAEFPQTAERVFVGKRCGNHAYTQTMIVAAMISHAMQGKHVVRLKGGDPAIFAHLTSELEALRALQIEVNILPGVTAMLTKTPGGITIRTLQTLEKIASEPSQKTVFVIPSDITDAVKKFVK